MSIKAMWNRNKAHLLLPRQKCISGYLLGSQKYHPCLEVIRYNALRYQRSHLNFYPHLTITKWNSAFPCKSYVSKEPVKTESLNKMQDLTTKYHGNTGKRKQMPKINK
jgi:hypothetical protein